MRCEILKKMEQTIARCAMVEPADRILTAVSGGPDSIALLHLLMAVASRCDLELGAAHLNHNLRGEASEDDAAFAASHVRAMGLKCHLGQKDVRAYQREHKLSVEHAARRVRHDFLFETAMKHGYNKIALGHQYDDNAELVLMNLLRGSGPLGVSGIPPVRKAGESDVQIIRPLIDIPKKMILEYLETSRLPYQRDASNQDARYRRNRIRHELIPFLQASYNPAVIQTLNQLADIMRTEEEWIETQCIPLFEKAVIEHKPGRVVLSISKLERNHLAIERRIIRRALFIAKGDYKRITYTHVALVMQLLTEGPVIGSIDLPDRVRVERKHDKLVFTRHEINLRQLKPSRARDNPLVYKHQIPEPQKWRMTGMETSPTADAISRSLEVAIEEIDLHLRFSLFTLAPNRFQIPQNSHIACLDMEHLCFPLILRNRQRGDRFHPLGMSGSQKLAKFVNAHKVEPWRRANCPVLVSGDEIAWVVGQRLADGFKITSSTQKVLKVEVLLAY